MIVTVTPNPAVDITLRVSGIDWGESNRVAPSTQRAGGKGLNVARVLSQMDQSTRAIASVGPDDLGFFARDLAEIPHSLVMHPGTVTRRSIAIVEDPGAHRVTVLNEVGHIMPEAVWDDVLAATSTQVRNARCLVVSGSTPPGFASHRLKQLFTLAAQTDIPCIADLSGDDLLLAADCGAALLKPNRRELKEATGESDPLVAARSLIDRGAIRVMVSLGEAGMLLVTRFGAIQGRGPVVVGNPTGAGDAAVASLAAHLGDGISDGATLLTRAIAWAAASVSAPEAGVLGVDPALLLTSITIEDVWSPA